MALLINLPEPHITVIDVFGFMCSNVDFAVHEIGDFVKEKIHKLRYLHYKSRIILSGHKILFVAQVDRLRRAEAT